MKPPRFQPGTLLKVNFDTYKDDPADIEWEDWDDDRREGFYNEADQFLVLSYQNPLNRISYYCLLDVKRNKKIKYDRYYVEGEMMVLNEI